jgi:hypothetical protein
MSGLLAQRLAVPWPKPMRTLGRDARGYPIPYLVLIDRSGLPQFTINDQERAAECDRKGLCAICGKRLERTRSGKRVMWFVGGSRAFLHPAGAFLDPPMHHDCAEYALRVCPFLAARRYAGRIDDAKLAAGNLPEGLSLIRHEGMAPALPPMFGFGMTYDVQITTPPAKAYIVDDWRYLEWWHAGERIPAPDSGEPPP